MPANPTPEERAALQDRIRGLLAMLGSATQERDQLRADLATERAERLHEQSCHDAFAKNIRALHAKEIATERTARESLEKELSELRSGLEPGKAGVVVDWVHQFAEQEFGRGRHLSDSAADWIIKGVGALRMERDEARAANQILTEAGVRGHEAVCALTKERDGLANSVLEEVLTQKEELWFGSTGGDYVDSRIIQKKIDSLKGVPECKAKSNRLRR